MANYDCSQVKIKVCLKWFIRLEIHPQIFIFSNNLTHVCKLLFQFKKNTVQYVRN